MSGDRELYWEKQEGLTKILTKNVKNIETFKEKFEHRLSLKELEFINLSILQTANLIEKLKNNIRKEIDLSKL